MDFFHIVLLIVAGSAGGLLGGLLGVGGGIVFTPALFLYFRAVAIPGEHLTALSIGTGLLCTLVVAMSSTAGHWKRAAIDVRVASICGVSSIFAIVLTTTLITTSVWYTPDLFQGVFSIFLAIVAARMILQSARRPSDTEDAESGNSLDGSATEPGFFTLFSGGSIAGFVASAVGVGGGIVLVPLFDRILKLPIRRAIGTSSATIVLITSISVLTYMIIGYGNSVVIGSVGYVDLIRATIVSVPAGITARAGVHVAHKIDRRYLRIIFAVLALIVSARLLTEAIGIF